MAQQNRSNKRYLLLILCSAFLTNCGRKKNIFAQLSSSPPQQKINKLTLPSVQGIRIEKTSQGNVLSWDTPTFIPDSFCLIGYNVYIFICNGFIPKKPCNKRPITQTTYLLPTKNNSQNSQCYLIRAVFAHDSMEFEGPSSKIIKVGK